MNFQILQVGPLILAAPTVPSRRAACSSERSARKAGRRQFDGGSIELLLTAFAGVAITARKSVTQRRQLRSCRRFFGGAAESEDTNDPGRAALHKEFLDYPGTKVFSRSSECGSGVVIVSRHDASEQIAPIGWFDSDEKTQPFTQEWRTLRFLTYAEQDVLEVKIQSVSKVGVFADAGRPPIVRADVLAAGTSKALVSAALAAAQACGAGICDLDKPLRALVIGVGSGSVPVWLVNTFPSLICDAVELDPVVVAAAHEAMGLPIDSVRNNVSAASAAEHALKSDSGRLHTYTCGGEDFVQALAEVAPPSFGYDLVIIDAVDRTGAVPDVLIEEGGPFLTALQKLLRPSGGLAINMLIGLTGVGPSGDVFTLEKISRTFNAVAGGEAFRVFVPVAESSNTILGFSTAPLGRSGEESMRECLQRNAQAINGATCTSFSLSQRLSCGFKEGVVVSAAEIEMKYPVVEALKGLFGMFSS